MRNILDLVLLTTFAAHLFSQTQSKSLTCGTCHTDVARTQPATPMARALLLPAHNDVLRDHPKLQLLKNGYTYTVTTDHDASTYTVSDGVNTISAPIRWSFGAGAQTWVLEHDGNMYESLVSYYPLAHGLDTTVGDQVIQPK
ncbi:MAG: hypothetical protein JO061_11120, partial [Acidobacteriaceae bacterium]|nr:hypothetical protein [Acidobacteriaceae bacterium]